MIDLHQKVCREGDLPCARGEPGPDGRLCPYREHALISHQEHEAWHVLLACQGQLRLAPSGHVVGIDMNAALRIGSARGCDRVALSELLPVAEAGLLEALWDTGGGPASASRVWDRWTDGQSGAKLSRHDLPEVNDMAGADKSACCGPGYASPAEAMRAPREKLLYTVALYIGTGIQKPDYLATIDADPESPTYSQVISRLEMPGIGDELHHIGWNACSSCHHDPTKERRYLIVPGVRSTNLHIVDCATDPTKPRLHKVIEGAEIKRKTNLSAPHTVHCLGSDIIISMLGDARGEAPGGFLHLNENFEIVGRWENDLARMKFNYDFWYQPRHNVMVSSEWAAPNTFMPGFDLEEVGHLKYGREIHFWDFAKKSVDKSVYLGEDGLVPLEVRFHHDPDSSHGFVGAALSSNVIHWYKKDGEWIVEKIIDVENQRHPEWPIPVPGLISVILLSMDDRFLYFSNWLHGDLRQYDISDPSNPKLTGQVWMGGLLGKAPEVNGHRITGGPQMIQLSLDGKRLYVTTSLFSTWDNQFYPEIRHNGGCMLMVDCDTGKGGMSIDPDFFVDFGKEPNGPARCHETRYPGGDCTSDIWI